MTDWIGATHAHAHGNPSALAAHPTWPHIAPQCISALEAHTGTLEAHTGTEVGGGGLPMGVARGPNEGVTTPPNSSNGAAFSVGPNCTTPPNRSNGAAYSGGPHCTTPPTSSSGAAYSGGPNHYAAHGGAALCELMGTECAPGSSMQPAGMPRLICQQMQLGGGSMELSTGGLLKLETDKVCGGKRPHLRPSDLSHAIICLRTWTINCGKMLSLLKVWQGRSLRLTK